MAESKELVVHDPDADIKRKYNVRNARPRSCPTYEWLTKWYNPRFENSIDSENASHRFLARAKCGPADLLAYEQKCREAFFLAEQKVEAALTNERYNRFTNFFMK